MKNKFFKSMTSLILKEEDENDPIEVEDYSVNEEELDDNETNSEETEEETSEQETEADGDTEAEGEEDLESDSYSMDDQELDSEGEDSEESDGSMEGEEETSNPEDVLENHKKYVLLKTYKELLTDITNLLKSYSNMGHNLDNDLYKHFLFIEEKLNSLKSKITFSIQQEFLVKEYSYLLTSFLYFQKERDEILNLIENLIKSNNE